MTQTNLRLPKNPKTQKTEMFWRYKGGSTWDPKIYSFCINHQIPAVLDDTQEFDLYIWTPSATYGIELKATDMHTSLFPTSPTSLEAELKGDKARGKVGYLNAGFDHVVLVYAHQGMEMKDLVNLDHLMFKFPTIRRKSYMSQQNAIAGIYRMVQKGIPQTNLDEPSYFSQDLGNTLANQLVRIPGVSAANALALSILFHHNPSEINEEYMIDKLRTIFPDLKGGKGEYHHMVYVIYDYYKGGKEPLKNKQLVKTE